MSGIPSNALSDNKVMLLAPAHEKAVVKFDRPQQPSLRVRIKDNQPRFIVYTNVEGDKDNGKIEAALDAPTFAAIMVAIEQMADNPDAEPMMFECKNFIYPGGKRSEKPVVTCHVVLARDRNTGSLSICLKPYDKSRPLVVFPFAPTEWHNVCDRSGNILGNAEITRLYAKGWARMHMDLVMQLLVKEHISADELKARREANARARGNGGGYGGNRGGNNGGGGGYNNRAAASPAPAGDMDDDIPW